MMKSLSKIKAETEDPSLIRLLGDTINYLQDRDAHSGPSVPCSLEQLKDSKVQDLLSYCLKRKEDAMPEWQVIALKNGWKPPVG